MSSLAPTENLEGAHGCSLVTRVSETGHYLHEFERARRADEIKAKLVAGTNIRLT
jgi:hypothetical protein